MGKYVAMILTGTFFIILLQQFLWNRQATLDFLGGISNAYLAGVNQLQTGAYRPISMGG